MKIELLDINNKINNFVLYDLINKLSEDVLYVINEDIKNATDTYKLEKEQHIYIKQNYLNTKKELDKITSNIAKYKTILRILKILYNEKLKNPNIGQNNSEQKLILSLPNRSFDNLRNIEEKLVSSL